MKSRKIKQLTCYKLFHQRKIFILFWLMIWVYNTVESENITIITSELQEVPICQSITGGCPTPVHFTGNTQRENELPYPLDNFHKFTSRHTKEIYQDQHLFIFSKNSNSQVLLSFSLGHCWMLGSLQINLFPPWSFVTETNQTYSHGLLWQRVWGHLTLL